MKKYYLAYGSNLNMEQMKWRCPTAKPVGFAKIEDYELLFKGSKTGAYLTIEERKGSVVPVGVWEVDASDEKSLDRYEGFPSFYYKKDITVDCYFYQTHTVKAISAFVYIMHEERPIGIPSDYYVRTCAKGYADFGISTVYLNTAIRVTHARYEGEHL